MFSYVGRLYQYRDLCWHLALSDLRARFRRTRLGAVWAILNPLMLTAIFTVVMSQVFKQSVREYSVYFLASYILWDYFQSSILLGANSLLVAEGYKKQANVPVLVFVIRSNIHAFVIFLLGLFGYCVFAAIMRPDVISWTWLLGIPIAFCVTLLVLPIAIISAIWNLKVRDYQMAINHVLTIVWYLSPVFILRETFNAEGLKQFTALNPVASFCDMFRSVMIYEQLPDPRHYLVVGTWAAIFWLAAFWVIRKEEKNIVFYY